MRYLCYPEQDEKNVFSSEESRCIAEEIVENADFYSDFDDYLNEDGDISILGLSYCPSYVLSRIDPTAYRCLYLDYIDGIQSDIQTCVEGMKDGDETDFYGYIVEAYDDESDA